MWALDRFEARSVLSAKRKRLSLDAADRVLEARSSRQLLSHRPNTGMGLKALLSAQDWLNLAPAIRARFASDPEPGETRLYRGVMEKVSCTWTGKLMAWAGRLIGTPMAWLTGNNVPCEVLVYRDPAGGVVWERRYDFGRNRQQVAKTVKRDNGKGRLLECFGAGAGMSLRVFEDDRALHFLSENFFLSFGKWTLQLPVLLSPGTLLVTQKDEGADNFRFTMRVTHPLFGLIAEQDGIFRQVES